MKVNGDRYGNGNGNGNDRSATLEAEPVAEPKAHSKGATAEIYAKAVMKKFGRFITLDKETRRWTKKIWEKVELAQYEKEVIKVMPTEAITVRAVENAIKMMRMLSRKKQHEIEWCLVIKLNSESINLNLQANKLTLNLK